MNRTGVSGSVLRFVDDNPEFIIAAIAVPVTVALLNFLGVISVPLIERRLRPVTDRSPRHEERNEVIRELNQRRHSAYIAMRKLAHPHMTYEDEENAESVVREFVEYYRLNRIELDKEVCDSIDELIELYWGIIQDHEFGAYDPTEFPGSSEQRREIIEGNWEQIDGNIKRLDETIEEQFRDRLG